jgi:predicted heme/steroid binding protein
MTRTELAMFDGRDGRRTYIAVNGTIYDVTESPRWENGLHPPDHQAGQDLTEELKSAPHIKAVVERFPVVGTLEEEPPQITTAEKSKLKWALVLGVIIGIVLLIFLFK